MLSEACHAWMALPIMADATEVASSLIGEEDVGAEVDGLSRPLEAPTSARKFAQIHRTVDRDEDIGVFRNRLACHSEPMRAIRRTPAQVHAARTNDRTARSSSRRGSATEGLGL